MLNPNCSFGVVIRVWACEVKQPEESQSEDQKPCGAGHDAGILIQNAGGECGMFCEPESPP